MPAPLSPLPAGTHCSAVTVATPTGPAAKWALWTDRLTVFCHGCGYEIPLVVTEPPVRLTPGTLTAVEVPELRHHCGATNVPYWQVVAAADRVPAAAAELTARRRRRLAELRAELRRRTAIVLRDVTTGRRPRDPQGYRLDIAQTLATVGTDDQGWYAWTLDPEQPGLDTMITVRPRDLPELLPGYLPPRPEGGPTIGRLPPGTPEPAYDGPTWEISALEPGDEDEPPVERWQPGDILRVRVRDQAPEPAPPTAAPLAPDLPADFQIDLTAILRPPPTEPAVPTDAPGYRRLSPSVVSIIATVASVDLPAWEEASDDRGLDDEWTGWYLSAHVRPATQHEAAAYQAAAAGATRSRGSTR
ncbi:hypothetical protein ACFXPX_04510 [Kitasatospora sp. NPDC059146]|uniref:hypothetical protein n=1 Tax=unclassified Kitasatospora TaxID=2633591 RepID=UPI00367B94FC